MIQDPEIYRRLVIFVIVALCVVLGGVHAAMIRSMEENPQRKIKHGWWGFAYAGAIFLVAWIVAIKAGTGFDWYVAAAGITARKPFFDSSLNVCRFGWSGIFYISPEVKSRKSLKEAWKNGETIDWLHWIIFREESWIYQSLYLSATILIVVLM